MAKINKFSRYYETFEDWLNNFKGSQSYKERIIRAHAKYPNATLSQLRGHPQKHKKNLSELKKAPIYKRAWNSLTKRELNIREKSLEVLSRVREGKSLTMASRELHTNPKTVLKNTNAFKKVKGKWIPKKYDKIPRAMSIYEKGKREWIEISDSRFASIIGKYNNKVKEFIITENKDLLKEFKKPIKDSTGILHNLETDPEKLKEIFEAQEEPEFYEIYRI